MSRIKLIVGPYGEHTEESLNNTGGYTYKGRKGLEGVALYYKNVGRKHTIVYYNDKPFNKADWL